MSMPRRTARITLMGLHAPGSSRGLSAGRHDYNKHNMSQDHWRQPAGH